jgi:bifunctional non-homologous end joining protein LigD
VGSRRGPTGKRRSGSARGGDDLLDEYRSKRDFAKTPEPSPSPVRNTAEGLRFVIQKHAASHLHYDLRLEMQGVMRSWAVPKGPSLDPKARRLAMEVEDHPIEYNDFEGTIPQGEYGGGTVMLWDRGTYESDESAPEEEPEEAVTRGYREGKLAFSLRGERLQGSFVLVRTDEVEGGPRSKWLLIKQRDDSARGGRPITDRIVTSVSTDRTMEEIAAGKNGKRVWRSNRTPGPAESAATRPGKSEQKLLPMLATSGEAPSGEGWVYEPKYDGVRVLAYATSGAAALITRNGHDKARQFPEIVSALRDLVEAAGRPLVLDGEIVALDGNEPARFGMLQGRLHVGERSRITRLAESTPAAFVAFDLLLDGEESLLQKSWVQRRGALEDALEDRVTATLRISLVSPDRSGLRRRAEREGWEGIIAKRRTAKYRPSQRSTDWVKLKVENRQEFVIGGWTEPRKSRPYLGAILLGYYDDAGDLIYAGHTGAGFSGATLEELHRRLKRLSRKTPPFQDRPKTNERAHWVTPRVVVEVRFNEWTRDGKLRQPVFIGIRDDKEASEVVRESGSAGGNERAEVRNSSKKGRRRSSTGVDGRKTADGTGDRTIEAIRRIQADQGDGELKIGRSGSLPVTSLGKVFFPASGHTKGNLFEYYARMADRILPRMKDRPLVLKRFPNGVKGESFYQQAAPDAAPPGVRVETVEIEGKSHRRLVGGNLATLLYTVQLGAISYDPWHSRVGRLTSADYTVLDLDPGPGASFRKVVEVAKRVKEELDEVGLSGALKTSGSTGLHIYLPLPARTPLDAATLVARIIATRVASKHPKVATVERMTKNRPRGTVYVDFLQNILGKTVAGVYAVRARPRPTVSTPLAWDELTTDLDHREFTVDIVPERVAARGDLWASAMAERNRLDALLPADGAAPG